MKNFYQELFKYSHHCNVSLIEAFVQNEAAEKAIKLLNHILNAQQIWNNRIEPKDPPFGVWDIHELPSLVEIEQNNFEHSVHIVKNVDIDTMVFYTNSKGIDYNNSVKDILFHVINHSTYHRGQIATEFKQNGLEPLVTDYVFYKR